MATETGPGKWTDERLDDLSQKVHDGLTRTDRSIGDLRNETRAGFSAVDDKFSEVRSEMRAGFTRTDDRFDALQRTLILGLLGLTGTLMASIAAVIIMLA